MNQNIFVFYFCFCMVNLSATERIFSNYMTKFACLSVCQFLRSYGQFVILLFSSSVAITQNDTFQTCLQKEIILYSKESRKKNNGLF